MRMRMQLGCFMVSIFVCATAFSAEAPYRTTSGACFAVQDHFKKQIASLIDKVRQDIRKAKERGQIVAYLSTPVSPRGGGRLETNIDIARKTAAAIENRFGKQVWVLNPADYSLKMINGEEAGGGDYMAVWGDVLGGVAGDGSDFDLVYFIGPRDVWSYFKTDGIDIIGDIDRWIDVEIQKDASLSSFMKVKGNREKFLKFYGIRASSTFSKGARDEWNIVARVAARRPTGDDWAIYFGGNAIGMGDSVKVEGGYEVDCTT